MQRLAISALCSAIALVSFPARTSADEASSGLVFDEYQPFQLEPLNELGDDVIRFSSKPALGGTGYVVEMVRLDRDTIKARILYIYGHPKEGWTKTAEMLLEMHRLSYEELAKWVDEELAKGDPELTLPDGATFVCTDGPGYLTERRKADQDTSLDGSCGDHPNNRIALAMGGLIRRTQARWEPRS